MPDQDTASPSPDNRTNVRSRDSHPGRSMPWRLGMGVLSALAPDRLERWAFNRFCTPVRARPAPLPEVAGLPGHAFAVASGRYTLRAWDWGEGPTVLLVHGWSGHAAQMTAFVPALVAAGYHVVAFDQPAHGSSGGARTTLLEMRDAVLAVGRRFGLDRPLAGIVAHSLGAPASLLALDRGLRAERAVLLAPPTDPLPWVDAAGQRMGLPAPRVASLKARVSGYLRADLGARDAHVVAAALPTPLLVMHDQDDRAVPFAAGQALAAASPRAQFVPLQGLGHRRMLSDPGLIARTLAFIHHAHAHAPAAAATRAAAE
jgi:pimeloyl-ACP methyl ester carboxylesterase